MYVFLQLPRPCPRNVLQHRQKEADISSSCDCFALNFGREDTHSHANVRRESSAQLNLDFCLRLAAGSSCVDQMPQITPLPPGDSIRHTQRDCRGARACGELGLRISVARLGRCVTVAPRSERGLEWLRVVLEHRPARRAGLVTAARYRRAGGCRRCGGRARTLGHLHMCKATLCSSQPRRGATDPFWTR